MRAETECVPGIRGPRDSFAVEQYHEEGERWAKGCQIAI